VKGFPNGRPTRPTSRVLRRWAGLAWLASAIAGCEGSGSGGDGLEIRNEPIAPNCTPALGFGPSGLSLPSAGAPRAILVQEEPPGVSLFDIESEAPALLSFRNIGSDSDGDGQDDGTAARPIFGFPLSPIPGEIQIVRDGLAFVSTSNYEQVLPIDPATGAAIEIELEVPADVPAERYPLLPSPGQSGRRTGVSTLACIVPPSDRTTDSSGLAIAAEPACDPDRPSYLTRFTAGKALAAGRLFVATSNGISGVRFAPGTVLVYDWIETPQGITVRPARDRPILFTSAFNPTGLARLRTPSGRELVLVVATGAIGDGSGGGNVLSEAAVDVIDANEARIVASIPLGFAGPAFDAPAIDPGRRIAWLGSSSQRRLYAIDLRPLDDPALFAPFTGEGDPPILLDGLTTGFPDARVFTGDRPLELPPRADGRGSAQCEGLTDVALNTAGSEALATDFCDGTLTRVRIDLDPGAPIPWPTDRFQIASQTQPFEPNDALGGLRSPGLLVVRPGIPGVDFTSPDVFVLAGQPDAQLCALRVESL